MWCFLQFYRSLSPWSAHQSRSRRWRSGYESRPAQPCSPRWPVLHAKSGQHGRQVGTVEAHAYAQQGRPCKQKRLTLAGGSAGGGGALRAHAASLELGASGSLHRAAHWVSRSASPAACLNQRRIHAGRMPGATPVPHLDSKGVGVLGVDDAAFGHRRGSGHFGGCCGGCGGCCRGWGWRNGSRGRGRGRLDGDEGPDGGELEGGELELGHLDGGEALL
jgi:hypothetical protein